MVGCRDIFIREQSMIAFALLERAGDTAGDRWRDRLLDCGYKIGHARPRF